MSATRQQRQILAVIDTVGGVTAFDLSLELGMSTKAACEALSRMLERGLVRVSGQYQPDRGRPARIYTA